MEINNETPREEQLMRNLQHSLPESTEFSNSLSVYHTGTITPPVEMTCTKKLKYAFPVLPVGFYDILMDRVRANGFSDQRLQDAVAHVIDNCLYPTPTIANIISFDRRVKLYTYQEVCEWIDRGGSMEDFVTRDYGGSIFRILKSEAIQKGLL